MVESGLRELGIDFVQRTVEEGGISMEQLFFHDPDGFMIEVCNCEALPLVPLQEGEPAARVCKRALDDVLPVYLEASHYQKCRENEMSASLSPVKT